MTEDRDNHEVQIWQVGSKKTEQVDDSTFVGHDGETTPAQCGLGPNEQDRDQELVIQRVNEFNDLKIREISLPKHD